MTNAEVHGTLELILMELGKINKHLDNLLSTGSQMHKISNQLENMAVTQQQEVIHHIGN